MFHWLSRIFFKNRAPSPREAASGYWELSDDETSKHVYGMIGEQSEVVAPGTSAIRMPGAALHPLPQFIGYRHRILPSGQV